MAGKKGRRANEKQPKDGRTSYLGDRNPRGNVQGQLSSNRTDMEETDSNRVCDVAVEPDANGLDVTASQPLDQFIQPQATHAVNPDNPTNSSLNLVNSRGPIQLGGGNSIIYYNNHYNIYRISSSESNVNTRLIEQTTQPARLRSDGGHFLTNGKQKGPIEIREEPENITLHKNNTTGLPQRRPSPEHRSDDDKRLVARASRTKKRKYHPGVSLSNRETAKQETSQCIYPEECKPQQTSTRVGSLQQTSSSKHHWNEYGPQCRALQENHPRPSILRENNRPQISHQNNPTSISPQPASRRKRSVSDDEIQEIVSHPDYHLGSLDDSSDVIYITDSPRTASTADILDLTSVEESSDRDSDADSSDRVSDANSSDRVSDTDSSDRFTVEERGDRTSIKDSYGRELHKGDGVDVDSPCWSCALYVGHSRIVHCDWRSDKRVIEEDMDMTEPFKKITVTRVGQCQVYSPKDRVARALGMVGKTFTQADKDWRDFQTWVYTGLCHSDHEITFEDDRGRYEFKEACNRGYSVQW